MSGHSKWSTIKHKKAKTDQQRGKVFSKLVREIMIAAKSGDPDPDNNARLRLAVQKAKEANMPNDNIKRAIQKVAAGGEGANLEEITYEAYALYGVALLIEVVTDNKNRTLPNIKNILAKAGGSLATKGAVSYLFEKKGLIVFESGASEDLIMEIATEAGAEDIDINEDGSIEVKTESADFEQIKKVFDEKDLKYAEASLEMIAQNEISLDAEKARKIFNLIEKLEDDDDVQEVFGNYDVSAEVMKELA